MQLTIDYDDIEVDTKYQGLITFLLHNSLENIDHYELYVPKESISFARE